ncbi:CDP-diacylglycerol diphosphatase [Mesorhizobium sp. M0019]|uniref:CDP-diacylglycerol diphosphatase n=1 Tax=unclassified Mesorhizobium TaxID=325217 RepID=UPI003337222B
MPKRHQTSDRAEEQSPIGTIARLPAVPPSPSRFRPTTGRGSRPHDGHPLTVKSLHRLPLFPHCRAAAVVFLTIALLTAAATDVGSASAHRNALWQVVQTCALAAAHLGSAFPCEEVILPRQGVPGSALIKSPRYRTEFLLTPLTAVAGVESPSVRWQGSSQLWNRAWKARSKVSASLGRHLPRTAIAMAVNSRTERSQDQFHIHIDCVAVSVEKKLVLKGPKVEGPWQLLPLALMGKRYWIKAVDKPDLETTNVVGIIASGLPQARRAMHHVNVVVVGAELAGARPGFYILTNWESSPAERLLDHHCTSR